MSKEERRVPELRFKGFFDDWEQRKLGELSDKIEYGLNVSAIEYDGENKYIRITDINEDNHRLNLQELTSPKIDLTMADRYLLKSGDILFARTGASVGKTYIYDENDGKAYYAGFLIRARIKKPYNAQFIFQNTLTNKYNRFIKVTSQRSGQPGINAKEYSSYIIMMPNSYEQDKVGNFLKKIDNIVTLHQRKINILKRIKQNFLLKIFTIYGNLFPELRFKGYTAAWEQRKLGEISDIVGGGTPSTKNPDYWNGDIDWYSPVEIGNQIYVTGSRKKITKRGLEKSGAKILPKNTILFTSRAGIGNTAILAREGSTNQGFQSIIPNENLLDSYFIFSMTDKLKRYGETNGAGSTFVEVSGKQMAKMPIKLPSIGEQIHISKLLKVLDKCTILHKRKLEKLLKIKQVYLRKVFI